MLLRSNRSILWDTGLYATLRLPHIQFPSRPNNSVASQVSHGNQPVVYLPVKTVGGTNRGGLFPSGEAGGVTQRFLSNLRR